MNKDKLFNTNSHEIMIGKALGFTDDDILARDLFKEKRNIENYYDDLERSKNEGKDYILSVKEAIELDERHTEVTMKYEELSGNNCGCDWWFFNGNSFKKLVNA